MVIKEVEREDLPKLSDLYRQLVGYAGDYDNMCAVYEDVRNNPNYLLIGVYDDAGELVATASLSRCFDMTGDSRYYYSMENFVVDEESRNSGVGQMLMEYLENYIKENNGSYVNFTSSTERKGAHAFYKKMGYKSDYVKGFKKTFSK